MCISQNKSHFIHARFQCNVMFHVACNEADHDISRRIHIHMDIWIQMVVGISKCFSWNQSDSAMFALFVMQHFKRVQLNVDETSDLFLCTLVTTRFENSIPASPFFASCCISAPVDFIFIPQNQFTATGADRKWPQCLWMNIWNIDEHITLIP